LRDGREKLLDGAQSKSGEDDAEATTITMKFASENQRGTPALL